MGEEGADSLPCSKKMLQAKEIINPFAVRRMFELDFLECGQGEQMFSQEGCRFLVTVKKGICHRTDGHYELPPPLKNKKFVLPNNRMMAWNCLMLLKKKLESNEMYCWHKVKFVNKLLEKRYTERVPESQEEKVSMVYSTP